MLIDLLASVLAVAEGMDQRDVHENPWDVITKQGFHDRPAVKSGHLTSGFRRSDGTFGGPSARPDMSPDP
jgi:hypothetical protein